MEKLARVHKSISFVFAHLGERKQADAFIEVMKRCDNVSLDLSGTGLHRYGLVKHLVNKVCSERVLFGSDYPVGHPLMYVGGVLSKKISDSDKENIFSKNAERLLRL